MILCWEYLLISMNRFDLTGKYIVITGGSGLLGQKHAEAIAEIGGIPVIIDIEKNKISRTVEKLREVYNVKALGYDCNITIEDEIKRVNSLLLGETNEIHGLINNAANNPKMDKINSSNRLENFSLQKWNDDFNVGVTGAFLCSRIFGNEMVKRESGVIINISSDLGLIAPDQRLYHKKDVHENKQDVKPVSYSVTKHAIIGLTKYLATYWASNGVRANTLCPGGVYTNQPTDFVNKLSDLIPLAKMANVDDYKGAIQFLCSDASSYMNGATLVIDGGRTCW